MCLKIVKPQAGEGGQWVQTVVSRLLALKLPREALRVVTEAIGQGEDEFLCNLVARSHK